MNTEANQLLESLLSYEFVPVMGKPWSHVALFKEYVRRMAWWADALGLVDNWLTANIVYILELDESLDPAPLQELDAHLQSQALYQPMPALLQASLMFTMASNHKEVEQHQLENPYAPLVKLYTRGGHIRWNQRGFWEVSNAFGVGNIDIASYKRPVPFVMLDDEELELIDKGDTQTNIPNRM